MQEFAWLRLNQFRDMAKFAGDRVDERKLRLVACESVRRSPLILEDRRVLAALEIAEVFADRSASKQQLKAARRTLTDIIEAVHSGVMRDASQVPDWVFEWDAASYFEREERTDYAEEQLRVRADDSPLVRAARIVAQLTEARTFTPDSLTSVADVLDRFALAGTPEARWREESARCDILRDVVGNPFRPVHFDDGWRSDTAMSLARVMYETRDFGAMPILADALQDMGCENTDVLDHCRGNSPHVRGCWVADWVLGKS